MAARLPYAEANALAVACGNGDSAAGARLCAAYEDLMRGFARKYAQGAEEDFMQEARILLFKRCEGYDPAKASFYMHYRVGLSRKARRIGTALKQTVRTPDRHVLDTHLDFESLDVPANEHEDAAPLDVEDDSPSALDSLLLAERNQSLRDAVLRLPGKVSQAVAHAFGLDTGRTQGPAHGAIVLGVTVEAYEALVARGLVLLRECLISADD